jgi:hypothetical protein
MAVAADIPPAAVVAAGRKPRRRSVDLMIAATAIAAELPLYTANPGDFAGLDHLVTVVPVTRPEIPNERPARPIRTARHRPIDCATPFHQGSSAVRQQARVSRSVRPGR